MASRKAWPTGRQLALGAAVAALAAPGVAAEAPGVPGPPIACGAGYQVQAGETLHSIAMRAYGSGDYPAIQLANADLLPDASRLEAGLWLLIPCPDGTGPQTRAEARSAGMLQPPPAAPRDTLAAAAGAAAEPAAPAAPNMPPDLPTDLLAGVQVQVPAEVPAELPAAVPDDLLAGVVTGSIAAPAAAPPATALAAEPRLPIPQSGPAEVPRWPGIASRWPAAQPAAPRLPGGRVVGGTEVAAISPGWKPAPDAPPAPLWLLTGSGFEPFVGEALPEGGMIAELVSLALSTVAPEHEQRLIFVDEWSAHLDALLLNGWMDVGFPWIMPDCAQPDLLGREARLLCDDFAFSAPLYELQVAWYRRAGAPLAAEPPPARQCRAIASHALDVLDPPGAAAVPHDTAAGCLARLQAGEADLVLLLRWEAERALAEPGLAKAVAELPERATSYTLHAVLPRSKPNARAYLDALDAGLVAVMLSGDWFRIVSSHQGSRLAEVR